MQRFVKSEEERLPYLNMYATIQNNRHLRYFRKRGFRCKMGMCISRDSLCEAFLAKRYLYVRTDKNYNSSRDSTGLIARR